ncbi:CoA transferase [Variovorax sp. EBFNA2]|uniref:CaiB/BaiF CoA transferase family protein n=1 Tax=Variovorax sp. EBFNA2 TaxID=3342097 RepID=UPI0029BFC5F9|nr:CoA transferase [Variovorax boronicumulans]WPG41077.1 CoA transferase [Variovorax boronicumulans]
MAATGFGALDGIRVIDFTQMLAGPFCTQLLADQGAEVIKIEPVEGEDSRGAGPFRPEDELRAFGGYFASVNRNKRSIGLNLKDPAARDIALKLADSADVVVENYRAGVMDRLGLSYETLRERNPRLVYAAIRGFGDPRTGNSPYSEWPAFDVVAQAMGGLMQINGPDRFTPLKVGPGVGDLFPATLCAFGISSALLRVARTGKGQFVDVSMVDAVLALCERTVHQNSFQGEIPHPEGNRHPLLSPFGLFRAKDGFVTLAAHFDAWWVKLAGLIDRPDLATDTRTATAAARVANNAFVYEQLELYTMQRTKKELAAVLGGKIPFGPVNNVAEILEDPHFAMREMILKVDHPGVDRQVAIAGIPLKMTETPGRIASRAPMLGEHTDEILREIGVGIEQAESLRAERIIG